MVRSLGRLEYAVVRLPFGLLADGVVARYWDRDAPLRVAFEQLLGSLDEFAGRLLEDEEIRRRGQALRRETGSPGPAGAERGGAERGGANPASANPADSDLADSDLFGSGPEAASPWAEATDSTAGELPSAAITSAVPPGTVDVIFTLPADVAADRVALCGDFNDWSADTIGCARAEDGSWQATVPLEPGRSYRYRYLIDGERWENGPQADRYVPNPYGGVDSVIVVE